MRKGSYTDLVTHKEELERTDRRKTEGSVSRSPSVSGSPVIPGTTVAITRVQTTGNTSKVDTLTSLVR